MRIVKPKDELKLDELLFMSLFLWIQ